jgi:hypothetical protein
MNEKPLFPIFLSLAAGISLLFTSCSFPSAATITTPTLDPALTMAAQTIVSQLTDTAASLTQDAAANPTPAGPTDTPRPTNTPLVIATITNTPRPPTATPLVSDTPEPTLSDFFFEDDFETGKGWATVEESNFVMEYSIGSYRIYVKMFTGDAPVFSVRSANYDNIRVEVDVTKDIGPSDNFFGVMCRFKDARNYYRFVVSRNGYYNIGKKLNGEFVDLGSGTLDNVFNQGEGYNRIRADCSGDTMALYLNGTKLLEVKDQSFDKGQVGLLVGTRNDEGADVYFDNFAISRP